MMYDLTDNQIQKSGRIQGVVSFALSLTACVLFVLLIMLSDASIWFGAGCFVCSVTGLVLGADSRRKCKIKNPLGLTGFIISIIVLSFLVILILLVIAALCFFFDLIGLIAGLGKMG